MKRCFGNGNDIYEAYHDEEWGKATINDKKLFEILVLEGAQAGLNWLTILKKRENYKMLFYNFDIEKISKMTNSSLDQALTNKKLIRNRLKIYSIRNNAIVFLKIQKDYGTFAKYIWSFVNYKSLEPNFSSFKQIPTKTLLSNKIARDLKKKGMTFVGPTIIYSYMQAIGMTNDHLINCKQHLICKKLNKIVLKNFFN